MYHHVYEFVPPRRQANAQDDESKAAAELEAAVEESRKSSACANSQTQHRESTKIPSVIAHESSGLVDAGLVDDWSILPEEVEVCRRPDGTWWQLGTGGFGTVYKGLYHGIHPVAIKIIHHVEEERHKDSFIREASLLKALRHKNAVFGSMFRWTTWDSFACHRVDGTW